MLNFSEYLGKHLHEVGERGQILFMELCNEIKVLTPVLTSP